MVTWYKNTKILMIALFLVVLIAVSGCETVSKSLQNCRMETKYKTVNQKNCEYTTGCECVEKGWLGLGSCNSCQCSYQEEVCE